MNYIPNSNIGLKSYNFGADKIFVISEKGNEVRRKAFEQAWSIFNDFEFEFVDAVMAKDLSLNKLVKKGVLKEFLDPTANISKTIIAVALSHKKVYELIDSQDVGDYIMIMEDDARPSQSLFNSIQDGSFNKLIKQLDKTVYDCFFWGRGNSPKNNIPSTPYSKHLQVPDKYIFLGAQAYTLAKHTVTFLLKEMTSINMAADTFLDYHSMTLRKTFCALKSYITQYGFLTNHFFGSDDYDKDNLINVFASSTQIRYSMRDKNLKEFGEDYWLVHDDIREYIKQISNIDHDYSTGKPGSKLYLERTKWKKIIFKSFKELSGTASI